MESFRFLREMVWHIAGFASLRAIRGFLEDFEPLFEPTIVPCEDTAPEQEDSEEEVVLRLPPPLSSSKYYSVEDYHGLYLSGELTPTEVAAALLPLIQNDGDAKGLHAAAWFDTKADLVMKAAEASTLRYKEKRPLGILDGVPTAVKDEYEMEHYTTSLGTVNDFSGEVMEEGSISSWCVRKLEEAGCIILGKLHMVEFGLDTSGLNPFFPVLPNPNNAKYYTGGSSSGTGYAVATGLIPIGLGSDGGGSIRVPSSYCGIYGLKPTHGRVSFRPGVNYSSTCACLGPMAADIRSLAAVFSVIGQPHPSSLFPPLPPAASMLAPGRPRAKVLGIPEGWFARSTPAVQQLCRTIINKLGSDHGYTTVPITIPFLVEGQVAHAMTILTDAASMLPDPKSFSHTTRILLAIGRTTPAADQHMAHRLRRLLAQHLAYLWKEHPGMTIITPTTSCAGWPMRHKSELKWGLSDGDTTLRSMEYVWLANFCGLPSLTVPAGYVIPEGQSGAGEVAGDGLEGGVPVGLMATGEWASEADLLQFGLDAELVSAERHHRPPIWVDVVETAKASRK